jgi:prevent-host-death family protein
MRTISVRTANRSFSRLIAEVEKGETFRVTKNGRTVAEIRPQTDDPREDPEWRARYARMIALMDETPDDGYRVGKITENDRYGDISRCRLGSGVTATS